MKNTLILISGFFLVLIGNAQDCINSSSSADLDINNVRAKVLNGGDLFWDQGGTGNARYEVPKQTDPNQIRRNSIFASALWIGGIDASNGDVLVTAQTYRQSHYSYWPGPIAPNNSSSILPKLAAEEGNYWDKHFKVNRSDLALFFSDYKNGLINNASDIPQSIIDWPAKNNPYINKVEGSTTIDFDRELAPFVDANSDGDYDPMDGDYPKIYGDQAIWWVMNDVGNEKQFGGNLYSIDNGGIGLEVQVMAFAFETNDELNNVTFYWYELLNKGHKTLDSTYAGIWTDVDLGSYIDDYVGCSPEKSLGYCYNGDDDDDGILGYGSDVASVGVSFCLGIEAEPFDGIDNDRDGTVDELGEEFKMSNFMNYYGSPDPGCNGNPGSKNTFYNYLRNHWANGSPITHDFKVGCDQNYPSTNFMLDGNPILDTGWTEKNISLPGDRRFLMSMGPFTFRPGESKDFIIAIPWARSTGGALDALDDLFDVTDMARYACLSGFDGYNSIKEEFKKEPLGKVYPTLIDDLVTVELRKNEEAKIQLLNSVGQIVYTNKFRKSTKISFDNLKNGIYFYRISSLNNVQTGKLIKK